MIFYYTVFSRVSAVPHPEILATPLFTPPTHHLLFIGLAQKNLNLSDPPFMSNPPQNFGELDSPLKAVRE